MSAIYNIFIRKSALRELSKITAPTSVRIQHAIDALAHDPRPRGCRKLTGGVGAYRIRVGDFRVVYEIDDNAVIVVIVRLGHRKDVYR
jgi:mRNA interferase RelE/StbE